MFTFNGKQYARTQAEIGGKAVNGFYRIKAGRGRVAVLLMDSKREPKALISPDGVVVTAYRFEKGIMYMYSTTKETEEFLGIAGLKYSALRDMGRLAIDSVKQESEVTA